MDRLASFAKASPQSVPDDIDIFEIFHGYVAKVTKQATMDMTGLLGLQVALLNFALNFAPDRLDYVDNILGVCAETLREAGMTTVEDAACTKVLVQVRAPPGVSRRVPPPPPPPPPPSPRDGHWAMWRGMLATLRCVPRRTRMRKPAPASASPPPRPWCQSGAPLLALTRHSPRPSR